MLDNVNQTRLVLASGKLVLQKQKNYNCDRVVLPVTEVEVFVTSMRFTSVVLTSYC